MKKTVTRSNSCRDTRDKNKIKSIYRTISYDREKNSVYKKIMDTDVATLSSEEIELFPDKKVVAIDQWHNLDQKKNIKKNKFERKNSDSVLETVKIFGLKKKLKDEKKKIKIEKEKLKKEKELLKQEKLELEKEKEFIGKYWKLITKNS